MSIDQPLYVLSYSNVILITVSIDQPLYVRPHSKAVVMMAMTEDTRFLSRHLVMDYSLLVGLDEASGQLVVGIIGDNNIC